MKFERSELGTLFSKLRTAVPEVRAVGTNDAGILLSGSNAYATNLELSVRAGLSKPVEQDVVVPPRGVDFISGTVAPEISIVRTVTRRTLMPAYRAVFSLSPTTEISYPCLEKRR